MGYERNVVDLFIDIGRNQEHQGKVFEQPQTQSDGDESFSNESYSTYSSLEGEQYESDASIDIKGVVENDRFWESFDRLFLQDFPSSCCQRSSSPLSTNLIMDKLTLPQNKSCTTPKASNTSIIAKVVTEHPASALLALSSESTNSTFDSDCGVGCKQSLEKEEEILKIIELNIVQELKDMFFSKELLREAPSYDSEDEDSSATMLSVISEGSEESSKYEELKEIEGPESDEHLSARMQSGASPTSFTPYAFDSTITFSESFDVHNYLAYLTPSPPADESDELDDPGSDSSLNTAEYPKLIEHGPFGDQPENDPRQEDENKHSLRNCITFLNCSSPRRKTELSIDKYLRYLEEDNAKVEEISLPEISRSPSTPDLLQSEPRADVRFGGGCSPLVQSPPPLSTITEESFNIDEYLRYFYGEGINDQSIVVSKDDNDINRYLTYLDKEYLDNWIDACNSLSEIVDVVEDKQPSRLEQLRARKKEILTSSQQKIAESRKSLLASRLDCKNIYQDEELPVANRKNEVGTDDDRKPTQEIDKYLEYLTSTSQDGHMSCSEEQNEADIDSLRNLSVGEKLKPILLNSETDSSSNDSVSSGDDQNAGGAVSLPSVVSGGELGGQQCSSIIKATDGNLPTVQITVQRSVLKELQPRVH